MILVSLVDENRQKIAICKQIRAFAAKSLASVLRGFFVQKKHYSEVELRDAWLTALRKNPRIFSDGWYSPPPHGIAILIASDNDGKESRANYHNLRPEAFWPRTDIRFDSKNNILCAYASPFDKTSGIIGDFGLTLYFGKNPSIIDHLRQCYGIVQQVFEFVEVGKSFLMSRSSKNN